MNKYLTILCLIFTGCNNHSLKQGDCAVTGRYDIVKILEVGTKAGYLVEDMNCNTYNWHSLAGGLASTDCFDSFNKCQKILNK